VRIASNPPPSDGRRTIGYAGPVDARAIWAGTESDDVGVSAYVISEGELEHLFQLLLGKEFLQQFRCHVHVLVTFAVPTGACSTASERHARSDRQDFEGIFDETCLMVHMAAFLSERSVSDSYIQSADRACLLSWRIDIISEGSSLCQSLYLIFELLRTGELENVMIIFGFPVLEAFKV
jgi:hypothetical protein